MSRKPGRQAAPTRGMMAPQELHAARDLLSAELTERALALWGVEALLSAMDRRNGLGFPLPSATRHGLWVRLVMLRAILRREARDNGEHATEAKRASEVAPALQDLAGYHKKKILPRVAALPPLPSLPELIGIPAPAGAAVLPFPASRRRAPATSHDDDPPGAA